MKRLMAAGLFLLLIFQFAGCATIEKKFTRKKKEVKYSPAVIPLEQGAYQKKFSNEYYYKNHYTLWCGWHDDLLSELGKNSKKVARSADEAFGQLSGMGCYLVPEKRAQLQPFINDLAENLKKMPGGRMVTGQESLIRADLERIRREVAADFYYDKVKDSILPDTVDLAGSTHQAEQATAAS
jgi:hypothetical protein